MKKRRSMLTFVVVMFLAVIFCLPTLVAAGGSPNPSAGVGGDEKVIGGKQGIIIAVWTPDPSCLSSNSACVGSINAFLRIDSHVYYKKLVDYIQSEFMPPEADDQNFENFYNNATLNITAIPLPNKILEDFGLSEKCVNLGRPEILHEKICPKDNPDCSDAEALALYTKDVNNLVFEKIVLNPSNPDAEYVRILNCDVKVSFICPK